MRILGWIGTLLQVMGVFMMSGRIGAPPVAFAVMLGGSVAWLIAAARRQEWSMFALNATFCASNVLGLIRWAA